MTPEQQLAAAEASYASGADDDSDESYVRDESQDSSAADSDESGEEEGQQQQQQQEEEEEEQEEQQQQQEEGAEEGDDEEDEENGDDEEEAPCSSPATKKNGLRGQKIGNLKPTWINDPNKADLRRRAGIGANMSTANQDRLMRALRATVKSACRESCEHTMTWYIHHGKWELMIDSES